MKISSVTDVGLVRRNNEDFYFCDSANGLVIVADGVGGHDFGEVASKMAVECCYQYLTKEEYLDDTPNVPETLMDSILFANQQIIEHKTIQPEHKKMGTTLSCLHLNNNELSFAWIGDSRIYVINSIESSIHALSKDHTLYNEMLARGELAENYKKSILTRMVGSNAHTRADCGDYSLKPGDLMLVCTDGLSDLVPDERILSSVMDNLDDLDLATRALVELAKGQGGRDNITVVLVGS